MKKKNEIKSLRLGGVKGVIKGFVGSFIDYDDYGQPKSHVWFYELEVECIYEHWPEDDFRERRWVKIKINSFNLNLYSFVV